jgi:hypothetical protein
MLLGALCSRVIVFSGAINEGQNKVASAACTCKISTTILRIELGLLYNVSVVYCRIEFVC